jgi:hypothetical protein
MGNYDDFDDFHGTDTSLETRVFDYLESEWMVNILDYPDYFVGKAIGLILTMKGSSVPAIAGAIAMEILPI